MICYLCQKEISQGKECKTRKIPRFKKWGEEETVTLCPECYDRLVVKREIVIKDGHDYKPLSS